MTNLTTNRNHFVASQLYALAAEARRSALENGADREIAALHANRSRRMRARALRAARNGPLTSERIIMTNLTTNRNHFVASRLYALAADARRSALENGADRALAAIHADQARSLRARAVLTSRGVWTY